MNSKMNLFDTLQDIFKKTPGWLKNGIGLVTLLVGFAVSFRNDQYLYSVIIFMVVFLYVLTPLIYVIFKREPTIIFGQSAYKYQQQFRMLAFLSLFLVLVTSVSMVFSAKGKEYLKFAYQGTPTSTSSPTQTATSSPTVTITPSPKPISEFSFLYDRLRFFHQHGRNVSRGKEMAGC